MKIAAAGLGNPLIQRPISAALFLDGFNRGDSFFVLMSSSHASIQSLYNCIWHLATQLATERREKLKQILQFLWPLLRLAWWIPLAQMSSNYHETEGILPLHSKLAPLHVLYAHRRWLQEQGMELWPIILEPLLQSSRETQRWIRQWCRNCCIM